MPRSRLRRREQRRDLELIAEIERCGRLVQQQHVRGLRQRAGDHDALFLAAAQRREPARLERRGAGRRERVARDLLIVRAFELERAEVRVAAHQHDVEHGEVERAVRFLRHDGDAARELAARQPLDRVTVDQHAASERRQRARRRGAAASFCPSRSARGGRRPRRARQTATRRRAHADPRPGSGRENGTTTASSIEAWCQTPVKNSCAVSDTVTIERPAAGALHVPVRDEVQRRAKQRAVGHDGVVLAALAARVDAERVKSAPARVARAARATSRRGTPREP